MFPKRESERGTRPLSLVPFSVVAIALLLLVLPAVEMRGETPGRAIQPTQSDGFTPTSILEGLTGKPLIATADGTPIRFATPRNSLFVARVNSTGQGLCDYVLPSNSYSVTPFDVTFSPDSLTSHVEVTYVGQIAMPSGTTIDGIALECTVTQNGTTVSCSSTREIPFLLRRSNTLINGVYPAPNMIMASYTGYVALPNPAWVPSSTTPTPPLTPAPGDVNVKITLSSKFSSSGQACFQNLIIRY